MKKMMLGYGSSQMIIIIICMKEFGELLILNKKYNLASINDSMFGKY